VALDTRYRPQVYADVLGQEGSVEVLRRFVQNGAGFHQSYLFAGPYGSGKTTLGRILARSLLCAAPVEGAACDACISCKSILIGGSSENFFEIDAATNSGKDSIRKIVEELQYASFSGKRKIYLFDESHRLSTDALDALLKPMEDTVPGTQDKSLICIFCTTEPERMRATILSRCAPAFVIKPVGPEKIGKRLAWVADQEGIPYDLEALTLIGELVECHIRDALKAVEGVSMLGAVNRENVAKYLHLDAANLVVEILAAISDNPSEAMTKASELLSRTSAATVYGKLADVAMLSFRAGIGPVHIPSYMDASLIQDVGTRLGTRLLAYASRFASRPGRPTDAMLLCDVASLAHGVELSSISTPAHPPPPPVVKKVEIVGKVEGDTKPRMVDDVYVHPRAVKAPQDGVSPAPSSTPPPFELQPLEFFRLVRIRAGELEHSGVGREGQTDMGRVGADQGG